MKSSEVVIDFITSSHSSFPAGIFWMNCSQPSLFKASMCCVEEVSNLFVKSLAFSDIHLYCV